MAAVTICAVVMAALLKKNSTEYATLLSLITVIMILMLVLEKTMPLIEEIQRLADADLFGVEYIPVLLKSVGITILTQVTSNICKDSGQKALSYSVELAGRISILILCLPIITAILSYIHQILSV